METRSYFGEGPVSLLGFGCMRLPREKEDSQAIDTERARTMVEYALAHGINYFDTAYPYHGGTSETFIGEALSIAPRESFLLASKMPVWLVNGEEDVDRIFEEQLKKCRVAYFDNYLIHSVSRESMQRIADHHVYDVLRKKRDEGKLRHLGFSFHDSAEALKTFIDRYEFEFAQIQLNYQDWQLQDAKGQYELLAGRGLPVIVMEPVRGGSLATLTEEAAGIFREADPAASPASWALRYAASLPGVMTVLSGMSSMEQLEDNVRTFSPFRPLTEEEYGAVARALAAYRKAAPIPCTACGYCMDCPAGVDIPRVFGIYNQYKTTGGLEQFRSHSRALGESRLARNCVACGQCMERCPQHIRIPEEMEKIAGI